MHIRVAAHIVRANTQVSHLEALNTVDIQALIEDTMLDDAVALLGCHGASLGLMLANDPSISKWEGSHLLQGYAKWSRHGASPTLQQP